MPYFSDVIQYLATSVPPTIVNSSMGIGKESFFATSGYNLSVGIFCIIFI
jgi:hypothetical protein